MASKSKYDYKFRPGSYWGRGLDEIQTAIAGQWRREAVETAEQHGTLNECDPALWRERWAEPQDPAATTDKVQALGNILSGTGPNDLAEQAGRIDPRMLGGEYLPEPDGSSVEIARLVYASTTRDVISVHARAGKTRIQYDIVDEYGNQYEPAIYTSRRPLSMKQMVRMLLESRSVQFDEAFGSGGNLLTCSATYNIVYGNDDAAQRYRDWVQAESVFYPQLSQWTEQWYSIWIERVIDSSKGSPDELTEDEETWVNSEEWD